jgi:DNA-binding response OmpR family regulator
MFMSDGEILIYEALSYHFSKNIFYYQKEELVLSRKSKYILFLLLMNAGKLVTDITLQEKVW